MTNCKHCTHADKDRSDACNKNLSQYWDADLKVTIPTVTIPGSDCELYIDMRN